MTTTVGGSGLFVWDLNGHVMSPNQGTLCFKICSHLYVELLTREIVVQTDDLRQ